MHIYESAEDYLERILMLQKEGKNVRSIDIAESFGYSRASVSRAINNLNENGYIYVNNSGIITLSEIGYGIAKKMYDRHITLSSFFEKLGVPHNIAVNDACKIEHDLSDITYNAILEHVKNNKK